MKPREGVGVGILDGAAVTILENSPSLGNVKGLSGACEEARLVDWVVWAESFDCWLCCSAKLAKLLIGGIAADGEVEDGNCTSEVEITVKGLVFWVGLEDSGADVLGAPRLPKEAGRGFVPGNLAPMMFFLRNKLVSTFEPPRILVCLQRTLFAYLRYDMRTN